MSLPESILFATGNPHKLAEVAAILRPAGITVRGLDDRLAALDEPVEDGATFTDNAVLKARYYARHAGGPALADDSGLVVDALGGAPGVLSARYAGHPGPREEADAANNAKLIERLRDIPEAERTARFVCVMALCDAERTLATAQGVIEGRMLTEPRGTNGFGYDPLFYVPELGRTTAELPPEQKNAVSHRGRAAHRLLEAMRNLEPQA